jgi:arginine/lysine/histidine transporter system substrate-binding protein
MKMKAKPIYLIFLMAAILVTACGTPTTPSSELPTPVPPTAVPPTSEPVNTVTPTVSADPVWDRVTSSGKIVFGTSADYKPFESYDSNYQIVGFDASIARELGSRLGLQVEFQDIPFENLFTAIQNGQVDASIAAISVTPERQSAVDFSNVYYSGLDAVLARQGSGLKITSPVQLAPYRVGVQRGTTYETYLQKTLVDTGYMPASNLLVYDKPEHAVRDLKENRLDMVLMGKVPAEEYLLGGGLEIVGQSLNPQLFAIAMQKGSSILAQRINETLQQMQNDGTTSKYAMEYLQVDLSQVPQPPTPTPLPAPLPTPTPVACFDSMQFIKDVTVPDGTVMNPGQDFDKIWRIQNIGTCTWDGTYRIVFVQGDQMGGKPEAVKGTVKPGATYDMVIDQQAPTSPGNYGGLWQMVNGKNIPFGNRLWVKIAVPGAVPPTAVPPTATPVPPVQPTVAPSPEIYSFTADETNVLLGTPVTLSWSFSGQDLASARLTRTNPDGNVVELYDGGDVPSNGSYTDLPTVPGNVTYSLLVSSEFGGTSVESVFVLVTPSVSP